MILTEYDDSPAILNPEDDFNTNKDNFPKVAVGCFSRRILESLVDALHPEEIGVLKNANERSPIYKITNNGISIAVFKARVGGPACAIAIEEIYAMGAEKIVIFGSAGVLDKSIEEFGIIVPNAAIRDEGTSYHYLPDTREISVKEEDLNVLLKTLEETNTDYVIGKTWTTDAVYRETKNKIQKRKNEGCIVVEMECASCLAVAQFRKKGLVQFFYAADNLDGDKWDPRGLFDGSHSMDVKVKILFLALKVAENLYKSL